MRASQLILYRENQHCLCCGHTHTAIHGPLIEYSNGSKKKVAVALSHFSDTLPRTLRTIDSEILSCPACFDEDGDKQFLLFPAHVIYPNVDPMAMFGATPPPPKADPLKTKPKPKTVKVKAYSDDDLMAL